MLGVPGFPHPPESLLMPSSSYLWNDRNDGSSLQLLFGLFVLDRPGRLPAYSGAVDWLPHGRLDSRATINLQGM